jgi:hypothetical protein
MPTKQVNTLMVSVENLHDIVIELKTDMKWLKNGMIGLYSVVGLAVLTGIVEALIK